MKFTLLGCSAEDKIMQNQIDYKNIPLLQRFVSEQGKILSRRITGIGAKEQRQIAKAIKRARLMGMLQFVSIK